jgi:hypothetical protein
MGRVKKVSLSDIENYTKLCVEHYGLAFYGNIFASFIKSMKESLEEHSNDFIKDEQDKRFVKRCSDFTNKVYDDLNKSIY